MRATSPVEVALAVAIGASIVAAFMPAFLRNLQASRTSEAVNGLASIGAAAIAGAADKELAASFPPPSPLTPSQVPKGIAVRDPDGTWDTPTWTALQFRFDRPHRYAFQFDVVADNTRIWFDATAHGDLNGDGILSTFQISGERRVGEEAKLIPGLYVHREVE
ncbi:MAG: hypothetical protein FWD57_11525 [Polyangiaceae bacterium]|nr:hypothetical protein [Polyangiaceae bacterium]